MVNTQISACRAVARSSSSSRAFWVVCCRITGASVEGATYNLGQVKRVIADGVEDQVLEPVDNVEELLAQRRHNAGVRVRFWCSRYWPSASKQRRPRWLRDGS